VIIFCSIPEELFKHERIREIKGIREIKPCSFFQSVRAGDNTFTSGSTGAGSP